MGVTGKQRGKKIFGRIKTLYAMENVNATLPTTDDAVIKKGTASLTATQLKALNTTPISVLAAPGAGKVNIILGIFAEHDFLTTAFAGSNAMEFRYTSSNGGKVAGDIDAAFLLATADAYRSVVHPADVVPVANAPIVAYVPTADPTQGLGSVNLQIFYRTITI